MPLGASAQSENEPNDNTGQANPLTLGTARTGDIGGAPCASGSSDDFYVVTLPNDCAISITNDVSATAAGTIRVYAYNSGGGLIFSDDFSTGAGGAANSSTATRTCMGAGTYYFQLQRLTGDCYSYSFTVTTTAPIYANDLEPNNSIGNADANPVLAANTPTDGRLNFSYQGSDNNDYYRIQTSGDGDVTFTLSAENVAGGTVRAYIYNGGGGQINSFDAAVGANSIPVNTTATFNCYGQGTYYVLLQSIVGCGISYQLSYSLTPTVFANDIEANNTLATALALGHNSYSEGHLNFSQYGDNNDYYALTTPVEGTITVQMIAENAGGGTVRVYLFEGSGGQINSFDAPAGANHDDDTTSASFDCYGQGNYYILVQSIGGCGISYKLKYLSTGAVYTNDAEPNNTLGQALGNGVLAHNTFTQGHINFNYYGDNNDYYYLQTPGEGTMRLTMIAERVPGTAGTLRTYVFNSGGGQINSFDASAGGSNDDDTTVVEFECYGQGDYYLLVQSIGGCGISYKLKYETVPAVYANDAEPNNSFGTALPLSVASFAEGHINFNHFGDNDDRYVFTTADDGQVNLSMIAERTPASAGTLRIYVFNSGGGQITSFDAVAGGSNDDDTTNVTFSCYGGGLYYLLVQSIGGCGISYKLGYTLTAPVFGNDVEPNNTLGTAVVLNPDSSNAAGHLNFNYYSDNSDYYRVNLAAAGSIQFDFSAEAATSTTVRLYLFNSGGGQVTSQDAAVGGSNVPSITPISFGPYPADTYHILVQSLGGCGISYRFNCNDADNDGTCNFFDLCPGGPEPGTPCDDGSACTVGDVITLGCACAGEAILCNDNDPCTTDSCNPLLGCVFTPSPDTDNDGTCDLTDGCPTDANKTSPGNCGCGNPEPGATCDDGNVLTINDVIGANCQCAGVPVSCTVNGDCNDNDPCTSDTCDNNVCVFTPLPDGDGDGTCDAQDGCPADPNKTAPGICGCGVSDADSDSDGTADCTDGCPADPNKIAPGICGCGVSDADTDVDGLADCNDNCPNLAGVQGDACDDGNPNTINDVISVTCQCAGTPIGGCTENLTLSVKLDGNPTENTWQLWDASETTLLQSGGFTAGQANTTVNVPICVPVGCYHLRVLDSGNNGITGGGYVLRNAQNRRIIDASLGSFTSLSEIDQNVNRNFCVPIGAINMLGVSCDASRLRTSPVYCNAQPGATGYQFWIYDAHGTYNRRVVTAGPSLVPSTLNTNPVPLNVDLNVRARVALNNVFGEFGAACRIRFVQSSSFGEREMEEGDVMEVVVPSMSLYPNPNRDGQLTVNVDGLYVEDGTTLDIDVYDMLGKRVHAERGTASEGRMLRTMDLSGSLPAGIYMVNVTVEGQLFTQRLVMQ